MKKEIIEYSEFSKNDIRVGEIKQASPVEKSTKLLQLTVDLGEDYGEVQILSGIAQWLTPEELIGKKYLFMANLAPRPMMGLVSNGMLLAANVEEKAALIEVSPEIPNGTSLV